MQGQMTIDQAEQAAIAATAIEIPLAFISAGENDRKQFDRVAIEQLANDIAQNGLTNPITVRPLGDDRYEIVAGERRYRAHQHLGRNTIPCIVRDLSDEEADLVMLSENVCRVNLNPIEEATGYKKHIDKWGRSIPEIAQRCNVSADLIRRRIGLLELIPDVQHQIATGNLKVSYAESMIGLDRNNQIAALRELNSKGNVNAKAYRRICDDLLARQQQHGMFDDIDLGGLFEQHRADVEQEKEQRKNSCTIIAEMEAEIARLRAALAEAEVRAAVAESALADAEERAALAEAAFAEASAPAQRDIDRQYEEQRPRLPAEWQLWYEGQGGDWYCLHDTYGETDTYDNAADAVNEALRMSNQSGGGGYTPAPAAEAAPAADYRMYQTAMFDIAETMGKTQGREICQNFIGSVGRPSPARTTRGAGNAGGCSQQMSMGFAFA